MKKLFISLLNIFLLVSCGGGGGGGDAKMIADVAQAVAPVISSASSYSVQENQTSIGTALATASNYSSALSYSLSGADADAISINSSTGVMTFNSAPDFEAKNSYAVKLNVAAGSLTTSQDITISISNDTSENFLCTTGVLTSLNAIDSSNVISGSTYSPFEKHIKYGGLLIVALPDNTETFLVDVANTYRDILGGDSGYTASCVDSLIAQFDTNKKVVQRIWTALGPRPAQGGLEGNTTENFEAFGENYETTDFIKELQESEAGQLQINEVIEHILHTITVKGLSRVFPTKWDQSSTNSDIYLSMQEAINKGYYDISSYEDVKASDPTGHQGLIQQEFAYMAILTAWGLKPQVWPNSGTEWALSTTNDIQTKLPLFWKLYEETVKDFLIPPKFSDLQSRFN
jgi:hypothetical protein